MKACAFSFFSMSAARVYQQQDSLAAATRRKPVSRVGALLTGVAQYKFSVLLREIFNGDPPIFLDIWNQEEKRERYSDLQPLTKRFKELFFRAVS